MLLTLFSRYDCHINVECAVSLGSFKYAFKYIHKGSDRISLTINRRDEITRHLTGRYVGTSEAAWRTFHFPTHGIVPNVVRLQVHLPGQHLVNYNPDEPVDEVLERASQEKTSLTAFFDYNAHLDATNDTSPRYSYQEFPQHYTWDKQKKAWKPRQIGFAIGRMYFVAPNAGERFFLRTLLTAIKGPPSFLSLRIYNGVTYENFEEACIARELLQDDGEWRECLREACEMQVGFRLRQLFITILLYCEPSQPAVLWNEFKSSISEDLRPKLQAMGISNPTEIQICDYGLYVLNQMLMESGYSLDLWASMPQSVENWDQRSQNPLIAEQLDYDPETEQQYAIEHVVMLNEGQLAAYNAIMNSVENNLGATFFLQGAAGTGKTFVYNTICSKLRSESWVVLCVASSGISALLIAGGRTAHSMFKIPINDLNGNSFCAIPKESLRADLIRHTKLIIWDEISPQHRYCPEALDRTCRDIRNNNNSFGGITVVFGGDFQQALPVVRKGSRDEIIEACLQQSYIWNHITVLPLHTNMRLQNGDNSTNDTEEMEFANWLLQVGHGSDLQDDSGEIPLPNNICTTFPDDLISFIYHGIDTNPPPGPDYFLNRTILAARNVDVADTNLEILQRMAGEAKTYLSADTVIQEDGADDTNNLPIPLEFLRSVNSSGIPPGELSLKVGCPVILLRNLAPSQGLCNGTRMVVTKLGERVLEVRLIGGDHDGTIALIPRISLIPMDSGDISFKFRRRQFPVRLAFAMTINKAQGQSVKYVGLDLRTPVFAHGQLYVALSRATSHSRLKVLLTENTCTTTNVVYKQIVLD